MALIAFPAGARIRRIAWSLDRPSQVNRSRWTGTEQVVSTAWHSRWRAEVELAPIVGEANVLAWRAFLAQLKGRVNRFRLPAVEGAQHGSLTAYVPITARTNTTVTDLGGGMYRIAKSGGTNNLYDADAVSATQAGDFLLRIETPGATMEGSFAGLTANPPGSTGNAIDRAFLRSGGQIYIFEGGANTGVAAFAPAPLWLRRTGTTLTYESGSDPAALTVRRTVTTSASLGFDCSLYASTATFDASLQTISSGATAAAGAAGASTMTVNSPPALGAGRMATVPLSGGGKQLVVLTSAIAGPTMAFEPSLRAAAAAGETVETSLPYCEMALVDSTAGWSVSPGQLYGVGFTAEERY